MWTRVSGQKWEKAKYADFDALVAEQTKGGLNETNIAELRSAGVYDHVATALQNTVDRLEGRRQQGHR